MQTARQLTKHEAKIAAWKAKPLPYCITRYSKTRGRYMPLGKSRYASIAEASKECARISDLPSHLGQMLYVDFAGAYEQVSK